MCTWGPQYLQPSLRVPAAAHPGTILQHALLFLLLVDTLRAFCRACCRLLGRLLGRLGGCLGNGSCCTPPAPATCALPTPGGQSFGRQLGKGDWSGAGHGIAAASGQFLRFSVLGGLVSSLGPHATALKNQAKLRSHPTPGVSLPMAAPETRSPAPLMD